MKVKRVKEIINLERPMSYYSENFNIEEKAVNYQLPHILDGSESIVEKVNIVFDRIDDLVRWQKEDMKLALESKKDVD